MKVIKEYVESIDEELEDAKKYAECYLTYKAKASTNSNYSTWATKYKEMSAQELQHAMNLHDMAMSEAEELKKVYTPPVEMEEKWNKSHKEYIEKAAWIKQMLAM